MLFSVSGTGSSKKRLHVFGIYRKLVTHGVLAQLGEHLLCKQGVSGSIPLSSTEGHPLRMSFHLKRHSLESAAPCVSLSSYHLSVYCLSFDIFLSLFQTAVIICFVFCRYHLSLLERKQAAYREVTECHQREERCCHNCHFHMFSPFFGCMYLIAVI